MMPMAGEAYSIVNKTLETGGRGSTTTSTDFSGITDAFMKKAALHTQIGGMLMDYTSSKAGTLSNLELAKADIHMKGAELAQREDHFQREMKAREDADKMSPFEQITGVLAGAAAPAAAGFAIGGPVGAVVGGVAGGALTMGAGNSRTRQQNIIGNIGTISQGAMAIKGVMNSNKAKDSATEMMKGVGSVAGIFRTAAPGSEEFQGAERQLDNYISKYSQEQIQAGRPMGEVYKEAAAIKKEAFGGFDPNDSEMVANRKIANRVAEAKADPAFMRGDRAAVRAFQADTAAYHIEGYGKAPTKAMMSVWQHQANPEMFDNGVSTMRPANSSGSASMKNGTNTGANTTTAGGGATATGTESPSTGTSTAAANNVAAPSQNGLLVPNAIVPGAGTGVMAPAPISGSDMWGVDLDNGPEKMMADASSDFNKAAAKDPSLVKKALNQEDPYGEEPIEKPKMGLEERALDFLNVTGNKSERQLELEKDRENKYQDMVTARRNEKFKAEMAKPADMTKAPVEYKSATEQIFKEQPDQIVEAFQIKKKFGYDDKKVDQAHNYEKTAVQIKDFESAVDNLATTDKPLTVGQMKEFQHFMQGQGDGAMEGSSSGIAGSGGGASVQLNKSEFKRNLETQMQKGGEMKELTPDQVDKLYAVYQRQAPLTNILARSVGQEKGPLSEGDKAPFKQALFNNYDPDIRRNKTGSATMMDILFKNFDTEFGEGSGYETGDERAARKLKEKQAGWRPRANEDDEFQFVD